MICCLSLTAVVLLAAGAGAGAAWRLLSAEVSWLGPLVILGPILVLAGILLIGFTVEICVRLRRQVKRQIILFLNLNVSVSLMRMRILISIPTQISLHITVKLVVKV